MSKKSSDSEQQQAIESLRREALLFGGSSNDVLYRLRYDTMHYDYISPSVERLLGFKEAELKSINVRSLILETRMISESIRRVENYERLEDSRKKRQTLKWQADYLMKTKDGRKIWVSDISYPWFDEAGSIIGSLGTLRDITERVNAEEKSRIESNKKMITDEVTGLIFRPVFFDRVDEELRRIKRSRGDLSLMIISVDGYDGLLQKYGESTLSLVLKAVAKLIQSCLRETDMLARVSQDEFAVMLPDTPVEGAYWVGERIRDQILRHQFRSTDGATLVNVTASIGISGAKFDFHTNTRELFQTAESRLFIAKSTGQNRVSMDELVSMH